MIWTSRCCNEAQTREAAWYMHSPHSWGLETGNSIHKTNFKVHCYIASYVSLTKLTLLFMQFIRYCMTISYYVHKLCNLIHPVDHSASRDLHCIKLSDYFICLLGEQNGFYLNWSVSILKYTYCQQYCLQTTIQVLSPPSLPASLWIIPPCQ